ncbi:HEAT repeat domain-containing protein [Methanobrevibacter sp.]|uniref:HEAT repeat domain-containing protein n=1 Tax=Methanobrevibacter sp. TaxID=66852 RepID=UPI00388FDB9B
MSLIDRFKKKETPDEMLEKINNNSLSLKVREKTLQKINDEKILANIAMNKKCDRSLREGALRKISNQDLLMEIASSSEDWIGEGAAYNLNGENLLYFITNRKFPTSTRNEAMVFLNSQPVFITCLHPDEDPEIRKTALHFVKDKKLIEKIAKDDDDPEIRIEAINQFGWRDDIVLQRLYENEKDEDVRDVIYQKLH